MSSKEEFKLYKLLATVKYVNCNIGATKIIGIIKGSQSKDIVPRYIKFSLYGAGKDDTLKSWQALLSKSMDDGYVEQYAVSKLMYVPRITTDGKNWLKDFIINNKKTIENINK